MFSALLSKISCPCTCRFVSGLLISFHCVCFSVTTILFWLWQLGSVIWSQAVWYLWLYSFLRTALAILGLLWFHTIWMIYPSISLKKPLGFWWYIKSLYGFRLIRTFNYDDSSNQWTWNIFPFLCVFFNFFRQNLAVFIVQIFHSLG